MDAIQQRKIDLAARAAYEGDVDSLRRYIEEGISVDAINSNGLSLLHMAAYGGSLETTKFLLAHHANSNVKNLTGQTPLMFAVGSSSFNIPLADALVAAGADLHAKTNAGSQIIEVIAGSAGASPDSLVWLKQKGFDISANTSSTKPSIIFGAIDQKNLPLVEAYIKAGGSLDVRDNEGRNVLHHAAVSLKPEIFKLVADGVKTQGLDLINATAQNGTTPLHLLSLSIDWPKKPEEMTAEAKDYISRQQRIAEMMLQSGAKVDTVALGGSTALMLAAVKGNEMLVPLLLQNGASTQLHDDNGFSAHDLADSMGKSVVASQIAERMKANPYYQAGFKGLPKLDGQNLTDSLVGNGTNVPVYQLDKNTNEFRDNSNLTVAPLAGFQKKRDGSLLVVEPDSDHHVGTYFSALNTYTRLTGASRADAEKTILPVNHVIEPRGNFTGGAAPTSQMPSGLRALFENPENKALRNATFVSLSYYSGDEKSFHYDAKRAAAQAEAEKYYSNIDVGGIGFAVANDANDPDKAKIAKLQPWRANPATLFVGAASKDDKGQYVMDNYADNGPQISAPLPPYYDKINDVPERGTSFAAPAFNAYRLALYNGTAHLTPREVDAALMTTADTTIKSDSVAEGGGKPHIFTSNGTVNYNQKVGVGVANIGNAYKRAVLLDEQKATWLKTHGEDVPIHLKLEAATPKKITVGDAVKYEYSIKIPTDLYVQQLTSKTLSALGADGLPSANQSSIISPTGFTQQARADAYGNASLPGMYGIKLTAGSVIKIVSDQPLDKPGIDINGFSPDSFYAQIMRQAQADRVAEKLKASGTSTATTVQKPAQSCEVIATKLYNADVAACR